MVRTKVQLSYILDDQRRRVSFSKRRVGLMKKAHELSVLCNADVGVIVFSETGRLYESTISNLSGIIMRYNTVTQPTAPPLEPSYPDLSHLLAEQAEEIRKLRKEVMMLESKNMSLLMELEVAVSNNQPVSYENANMETKLTFRPPPLRNRRP